MSSTAESPSPHPGRGAGAGPFVDEEPIRHDLSRHFPALRAFRRRSQLLASPLYQEIGGELERLLSAVERARHLEASGAPRRPDRLRLVAWNIQRGKCFPGLLQALREDAVLREADVLLLSEVDCGMGRSGNRNVARELAAALRMNYAFGVSYVALEDDYGENPEGAESTLGLAGAAILSRLPLIAVENLDLPELKDKFSGREKRLGKKRALLAELGGLPGGPLSCASCHLDSNASPRQRAAQLEQVLGRLAAHGAAQEAQGGRPARLVGGGDLNTSTYDASGTAALFRDLLHKFFVMGFRGTVDNYMTPERRYEEPVFELLQREGFDVDACNDRRAGTLHYDLNSDFAIQKVRRKVGRLLTALLRYCLRPWGGVVPARLDWFFTRGARALSAAVVDPRDGDGRPVSDHAALVLDLAP